MSLSSKPSKKACAVSILAASLAVSACDAQGGGDTPRDAGSDDAAQQEDAAPTFAPLIDQSAWRNYAPELDPLASHQPETLDCNIAGWFIERGAIEISTADCNYLLVEHPAQMAVATGAEIKLELVHFDLEAAEPATAHVAVLFGDALQWELEIPVPSYAYVYKETFRATQALAEGEPIRLHLHNHGQNTWLLTSILAQVPSD